MILQETLCTTVTCPDRGGVVSAYCVLPDDGTLAYQRFAASASLPDCCCSAVKPETASNGVKCSAVKCTAALTRAAYCAR